ncbi:uncharacterized protein LOC108218220 [Daucus carota subsp. sativus]|uniref:uncharacterized protein LOC108218220 n=1 Tax=Daucus carota subsp. sativus TaxID=79200 RepID=UPI0007B1F08B|nr:PREDICTED: uncharacterized protein LOC108218220 [Daucus carota subsp. sativus]
MESSDDSFPAADVEKELNPGNNTSVEVDSVSSQIAEGKGVAKKGEKGKNDPVQTFKTTMIVSGVLIVLAGVALAISKKLRENKA